MATKSVKPKGETAAVAPPPLTQERRLHAALAHFHRFDKYWLERFEEALDEAQNRPPQRAADGSVSPEAFALYQTLLKRAKDWNSLRAHPLFPKSFVGE
jgi:hypothetical protein